MGPETFDPLQILRTLNQHEVAYAVIGGFAVASYGVVRATQDLDIVTDRGLENARRIAAALADLGAVESAGGVPAAPKALARRIDLRFETTAGALHLLREVEGLPAYRELDTEVVAVEDVEFRRPTLDALRAMKRAAGRDKDRIDLAELDAVAQAAPEDQT